MDSDKLRVEGKRMIDVVADYWETMRDRKPLPDIQPGFMNELVKFFVSEKCFFEMWNHNRTSYSQGTFSCSN